MRSRDLELAALFALLKVKPSSGSWGELAAEVAYEGSAERVLSRDLDDGALFERVDKDALLSAAMEEVEQWSRQGLRLVTVLDDEYPARLLDIRETPPFLFYDGELRLDDRGMSIVGTRDASPQGLTHARHAAEYLVEEGLTVISGLATGIDAAAHTAALDAGGRTVAFVGSGILKQYPRENSDLQGRIASQGLVFSQFYPHHPPTQETFPIRNASMSGYGLATIIIEAGEHSGTRIQARLAVGHGRPLILSSKVARETVWGSKLVGVPNVYVASTISELKGCIQEVLSAPSRLSTALEAMALA